MTVRHGPALCVALTLAACAGTTSEVRDYDCERGGPLQVTITGNNATLEFGERRVEVVRVEADYGERWAADGWLLWIRDGEASVTAGDQVLAWGCQRR